MKKLCFEKIDDKFHMCVLCELMKHIVYMYVESLQLLELQIKSNVTKIPIFREERPEKIAYTAAISNEVV